MSRPEASPQRRLFVCQSCPAECCASSERCFSRRRCQLLFVTTHDVRRRLRVSPPTSADHLFSLSCKGYRGQRAATTAQHVADSDDDACATRATKHCAKVEMRVHSVSRLCTAQSRS